LIAHGFSGSGKSHCLSGLAERLPAIRIASDIERKRLAGLNALDASGSNVGEHIYNDAMTAKTYAKLLEHAERLLQAGFNVLLDATFLKAVHRRRCKRLAERLGSGFMILDFQAPAAALAQRIVNRIDSRTDPSEANLAVLAQQTANAEALEEDEKPFTLELDGTSPTNVEEVLAYASSFRQSCRNPPS